jgi:hypothetical protein
MLSQKTTCQSRDYETESNYWRGGMVVDEHGGGPSGIGEGISGREVRTWRLGHNAVQDVTQT